MYLDEVDGIYSIQHNYKTENPLEFVHFWESASLVVMFSSLGSYERLESWSFSSGRLIDVMSSVGETGNFIGNVGTVGRRPYRRLTPKSTTSFHLSTLACVGAELLLAKHPIPMKNPQEKCRCRAWINTFSCRSNLNLHVTCHGNGTHSRI